MSGHDRPDREQHRPVKTTTPGTTRAGTSHAQSSDAAATEEKAEAGDIKRPEPTEDVIRHLAASDRDETTGDDNEYADRRARIVKE